MSEVKIVCGACKLPPDVVTDDDGNSEAVCPGCGQRDKVEDALRIGGEHYVEGAKAALNKKMRDVASGSKFIKFESGFSTGGTFKWHAV
jgi:hypothetical protein